MKACHLSPVSWAALALLLATGACQSPQPPVSQGKAGMAMPTLASTPDVRTEAAIVQMENQYIADKNDQPTRQHEAEAKAARKKQEQAQRAAAEKAEQDRRVAEASK